MAKSKNSLNTLLEALSTSFSEDLEQVLDLWERMGLSEAQVKERHETVIAQLTTITKNMVDEETKNEAKIKNICQIHFEKISSLRSELECEALYKHTHSTLARLDVGKSLIKNHQLFVIIFNRSQK